MPRLDGVEAIADTVDGPVELVIVVDEGVDLAGDGPQFDRDHVVEHPAPVREAGHVAANAGPECSGIAVLGGIEVFSRSMSACTGPVKLVKPVIRPLGMPVSRIASRSSLGLLDLTSAARFGNAPG